MKFKSYLRKGLNKIRKFFSIKRNVVITSLVAILIIVSASIFMNFEIIASRVNTVIHDIKMASVNVDGMEISNILIDKTNGSTIYDSSYVWDATNALDQRNLVYQINYKNNDVSKSYAVGDLEFVVPNLLYEFETLPSYYYNNHNIEISADLSTNTNKTYEWSYRYDEDNHTIVFTNNNVVEANTNFEGSVQISYNFYSVSVINGLDYNIVSKLNNQLTTNTINFKYTANKREYSLEETRNSRIENLDGFPSGYTWVKIDVDLKPTSINVIGAFNTYLEITLPEGAIIYKGSKILEKDSNGKYIVNDSGSPYRDDIPNAGNNMPLEYYPAYRYFYIGYPNDLYKDQEVSYNFKAYGKYYRQIDYVEDRFPYSDEYEYLCELSRNISLSNFNFTYNGNLYYTIKRNLGIDYDNTINGKNGTFFRVLYKAIYTGEVYDAKIGDDVLFYTDNNGVLKKMSDDKYYFTGISIPELYNGNRSYITTDKYDIDLFVRYANTNEYIKYDTYKNGYARSITFKNDEKVVGWYLYFHDLEESLTCDYATSYINSNVTFIINDINMESDIYNFSYIDIYMSDKTTPVNIPDDSSYTNDITKNYIMNYDHETYGRNLQRSFSKSTITNFNNPILIKKGMSAFKNSGNNIWNSTVTLSTSIGIDDGRLYFYQLNDHFKGTQIFDLLPAGMNLASEDIKIYYSPYNVHPETAIKKSDGTYFNDIDEYNDFLNSHLDVKIINNWNNTNRTMIVLTIDLRDEPLDFTRLNYFSGINSYKDYTLYNITYDVSVNKDAIVEYGSTYKNTVGLNRLETVPIDTFDSYEKTASATQNINVASESNQDLTDFVKTNNSNYEREGIVSLDSQYTYKLRARNASNKITNLVIYDSIENYVKQSGEYVLARGSSPTSFKGTFKGVDTSYAESKGYTVKVYYSESEQPGSLSEDTSWKVYSETTNKSKVKSLAFEYLDSNGNKAILPADSLTYVEVIMQSPASVVDDKVTTYNGSWVEWNALDSSDNVIPDVVGINSNIVSVSLPLTLKVKHLIKDTNTELLPEEVYEKQLGDEYTTSMSTEIPSDYIFDSTAGDATSGNITKAYTEVIYYYRTKEPILSSTIDKTGTDTISSRNSKVNYQISYTGSVKDFIGTANITIVDTLPYEIDTAKEYDLNGGTYNASNKTITWNKTITTTSIDEVSDNFNFNISFSYKNIPVSITNITNKVTGTIEANTKTDVKEKTTNTNITEQFKLIVHHYYDGTIKSISKDVVTYHDGGSAYNTTPASVADDYEVITPANSSGIISQEETVVIYYYKRKDPTLNGNITKTGTDAITSFDQKVNYTIEYKTTVGDYLGNVNDVIVDTLPFEIDTTKDYDLNGGTYNASNKTITWNNSFNKTNIASETKTYTYNISFSYKDVNHTTKGIKNDIVGKTILDNKNIEKTSTHTIGINIKGKIIVKYIDIDTEEELHDQIEFENIIYTNKFIPEAINIDKYDLVESPSESSYDYEEGVKTLYYKYRLRKHNIITKVSGNGGTIKGDEEVIEGQDSTKDNIVIKADDSYTIYRIMVNGNVIEIEEGLTEYTLDYFKDVREDKLVVVEFTKRQVANPATGSFTPIIIISTLIIGGISLYLLSKKKLLFRKI